MYSTTTRYQRGGAGGGGGGGGGHGAPGGPGGGHHSPYNSSVEMTKRIRRTSPLYPTRLTYVISGLKIIFGSGLVVMGALALYHKASYGRTAAGLWAGIMVIISGVLGIFSVKMGATRPYVLSFLASCILSLMASVLVIIYSGTGLARDSGFPGGFVKDPDTGDLIPVSQVNLPARKAAMFVNLILILLGVLDITLSLPGCVICLREICQCYSPRRLMEAESSYGESSAAGRNDWLMNWLGQQSQIFYSNTSGVPYGKIAHSSSGQPYHLIPAPTPTTTRATPPFVFIPSERSSSHSPKDKRNRSPMRGGYHHPPPQHYAPVEIFPPMHQSYYYSPPPAQAYPSPGSNMMQLNPWGILTPEDYEMYLTGGYAPGMYPHLGNYGTYYAPSQPPSRPHHRRSKEHTHHQSSHHHRQRRHPKGPTDADLDKTYTGLDRELAEEFIEQTMDPSMLAREKRGMSEESDHNW